MIRVKPRQEMSHSKEQLAALCKPFNGSGDVYEFFECFEIVKTVSEWSDAKAALMIVLYLRGNARQRYDMLSADDKKDYKKVKEHLIKQCGKDAIFYLNEFYNRKLMPGEGPKDYGLELAELLERALPNLTYETIRGPILKTQLMNNLPPKVRGLVNFTKTVNWDDLLNALDSSYNELLQEESAGLQVADNLEIEINKLYQGRERKINKFSGTCYKCHKQGHRAANCWAKQAPNESDQPRSSRQKDEVERSRDNNYKKLLNTATMTLGTVNVNMLRVDGVVESDGYSAKLDFLVDSGASHSFIHPKQLPVEWREELKKKLDNPERYGIELGTSDVRLVKSVESIEWIAVPLRVRINDWTGTHKFFLSTMLNTERAILGKDFLDSNDAVIYSRSNTLSLSSVSVKEEEQSAILSHASVNLECVAVEKKTLQPRSSCVVTLKSSSSLANKSVVFEGNNEGCKSLLWSRTLCEPNSDGTFSVSVVNLASKTVVINKNELVGTVCEAEEIIDVDEDVETGDADETPVVEPSDEEKLKQLVLGELSVDQQAQMKKLLASHLDLFQWGQFVARPSGDVVHRIDTGDHRPIKTKQYHQPFNVRKELAKQVEQMKSNNVIRDSKSPWNSPVILVKKKNGTYRFVVDFRRVNEVTIKDAYPLPLISETIDALAGAEYFTCLDFASGYWGIPLDEKDKEKTAFTVDNKLYEFNVMPFGLTNAPATFQRYMDSLLLGLTWNCCLVYLDDIIIFGKSFEDMLSRIKSVFGRIRTSSLKLQPQKCVFGAKQVSYLGFIISSKGLGPDSTKVDSILNMSKPKNWREMKRFIGTASFYRRFIKNFSDIAHPLLLLTDPKSKFVWSQECDVAFSELKQRLTTAPILIFPDFERDFLVECDASQAAIGAVLMQERADGIHPICFASRHLSKTESNYSATERELLCIVWASKYFRNYIFGRHVTFFTDHKPLVTARQLKEHSGRLARLFFKLQELDYEIVYKKGEENVQADFLSRLPTICSTTVEPLVDWKKEQAKDDEIKNLVRLIGNNISDQEEWRGALDTEWLKSRHSLVLDDDILYKANDGELKQLVVPKHLRYKIFQLFHDCRLSGHRGVGKTYSGIAMRFFWPGMSVDIKDWCESCDRCQRLKPKVTNMAPLKPIEVSRILELVVLDVVGPLPVTKRQNRYIIVGIDHMSKWLELAATKTFDANTTAEFIVQCFIGGIGTPESIHSDQGRNFESAVFQRVCELCGISKTRSTSHHHEGVGLVERVIRTVKDILRCHINSTHDNWDDLLYVIKFCYNSSVQASTGFSPYEIVFARKPTSLQDLLVSVQARSKEKSVKSGEYVKDLIERSRVIQEIVRQNLEKSRANQKFYYDQRTTKLVPYETGDLVLLKNFNSVANRAKKLLPKFIGPFVVIRRLNELNYEVRQTNGKSFVVHYNRMLPYKSPPESSKRVVAKLPEKPKKVPAVDLSIPVDVFWSESSDDTEQTAEHVENVANGGSALAEHVTTTNNIIAKATDEDEFKDASSEPLQEVVTTTSDTESETKDEKVSETEKSNVGDQVGAEGNSVSGYSCTYCGKKYVRKSWFIKHLQEPCVSVV